MIVRRERLLRLLDDYREDPVICLQAPGGFGKTSVLAQWTAVQDRAVAWLTVRPQAPDAEWLVEALVTALRGIGLLDPSAHVPIGTDPLEWHLATLPALERQLDSITEPFLLVIDDAGALAGDTWESLAASFAAALPQGSQLVLATRGDLPSSLQRLRANDGVGLIGPNRLAFDAVEGAALLATLAPKLRDSDVTDVLEATGGWPVAVYLARTIPRPRPAHHERPGPGRDRRAGAVLPCRDTAASSPHGRLLPATRIRPYAAR